MNKNESKIPSGDVTFLFTDIEGSTFQFSMFNFKCSILNKHLKDNKNKNN